MSKVRLDAAGCQARELGRRRSAGGRGARFVWRTEGRVRRVPPESGCDGPECPVWPEVCGICFFTRTDLCSR